MLVLAFRMLRLSLLLLEGVATCLAVFPFAGEARRQRLIHRWSRRLLAILHIRLRVSGNAPTMASHRLMVVANHVSWLDIYLLNAVRPLRFVSKAEVRRWPLIGWLAAQAGTLFIERGRRQDTVRLSQEIQRVLEAGGCTAFFPEGTTTDGARLRHFHASLLEPAVRSHSPVLPAALRYLNADGTTNTAAAYYDNISFGESLLRIMRVPEIHAEVVFFDPIPSQGKSRRELAQAAQTVIASVFSPPAAPRTATETPADPPAAAQ